MACEIFVEACGTWLQCSGSLVSVRWLFFLWHMGSLVAAHSLFGVALRIFSLNSWQLLFAACSIFSWDMQDLLVVVCEIFVVACGSFSRGMCDFCWGKWELLL